MSKRSQPAVPDPKQNQILASLPTAEHERLLPELELVAMPLEQLKIDQHFVRDILKNTHDAAISKMVIALAQSVGLTVIAEGVETTDQRDFLASQGSHAYQGFLFSCAMPLYEFEAFAEQAG